MIPSFAYTQKQTEDPVKVEINIPKVDWEEILPEVTIDGIPFAEILHDFLVDLSDTIASLYDQIIFIKYGRIDLAENNVRVSFSKEAFGEVTENLKLSVERVSLDELVMGGTNCCGFAITPANHDIESIVYRVYLTDSEGNCYLTPSRFGHRIHIEIDTPDDWEIYDTVNLEHYVYSESENRWDTWSCDVFNDGSVFMIYTSL